MPLDKETIKHEAEERGLWPRHEGIVEKYVDAEDMKDELIDFAQAICELVVKEERERCANLVEEEWLRMKQTEKAHYRLSPDQFNPAHYGFDQFRVRRAKECADAIRRGD